MLLNIAEMAREDFKTVVFVLGRRAGKGVMIAEIIVREVEKMMSNDDREDLDGYIYYVTTSYDQANSFSNMLENRLSGNFDFEKMTRSGATRFIFAGEKKGVIPSRITIEISTIKNGISFLGKDKDLAIYDDIDSSIDNLHAMTRTAQCRSIVFRSEYEDSDEQDDVLIVQAPARNLNPPMT